MGKTQFDTSSIVIPSTLKKLVTVERFAEKFANKNGLAEEEKDNLAIAVTEAVNNAIVHGNKNDHSKKVHVEFSISENELRAVIRDEGNGFDPNNLSNPTDPENLLKESGRGIFILKSLMDDVSFSFSSKGTEIILTKKL